MPGLTCNICQVQIKPTEAVGHVCDLPEPVEPRCSKCNSAESEVAWELLIPITVVTNPHEEGYSEVTQLLCDDCFGPVRDSIQALGFVNHSHGSTDFLEDAECPGWGQCPTPTDSQCTVPGGGFEAIGTTHKRLATTREDGLDDRTWTVKTSCMCGWTFESRARTYEHDGKVRCSEADNAFNEHVGWGQWDT